MLIEVEGLTHRYAGQSDPAVRPLTYRFTPGSVTAITGVSGSGKSTLLYVLALLLTPTGGRMSWDGHDVHTLVDAERSRLRALHVGFVFQDAMLDLSQTAEENVLEAAWIAGVPRALARERAAELMERFAVTQTARFRPGQVSGGQAQRVALCRALVTSPSVVFADEPTGNLDEGSADIVWSALEDVAHEGATVVVATHDRRRARSMPHHLELNA